MADAGYTPDPADVELVARAMYDDQRGAGRYDGSHRAGQWHQEARDHATSALSALAATGRLADPNAETRTEHGVRLTWDNGTVEEEQCDRKHAEGRVRWHAERRAAVPGWRVTSAEVVTRVRTTSVGPWQPAPTETP